jgi:hypothetical protein
VRLSPKLADLFDMIEHSGERGVLREVLAWVFFPNKPKHDAERLISVHIGRINDLLEETNIRISMSGRRLEPYRIVPREMRAA